MQGKWDPCAGLGMGTLLQGWDDPSAGQGAGALLQGWGDTSASAGLKWPFCKAGDGNASAGQVRALVQGQWGTFCKAGGHPSAGLGVGTLVQGSYDDDEDGDVDILRQHLATAPDRCIWQLHLSSWQVAHVGAVLL